MGYQTNDSLIVPWGIGLYPIADATSNSRGVTARTAANPIGADGSTALTIGWHADGGHTLFQVQWQWMRRLNPAQALVIEPGGSDLWYGWDGADLSSGTQGTLGEYGAWQGNVLASEVSTSSMPRTGGAANPERTYYLWNPTDSPAHVVQIAVPYDVSTYDAARLHIRARTLTYPSSTTKVVSNWGEAEVFIGFVPSTTTTAERNEDGSVTLSVQTNLQRGGNLAQFTAFYGADGSKLVGGVSSEVGDDFTVTIPAELAPDDTLRFGGSTITTSDGVGSDPWAAELGGAVHELPITSVQPVTPIPEPVVTVDSTGAVTVEDDGYDSVLVRCSYVDEDGNSYSEQVEMTLDDGVWTGHIPTPPLDVVVDVTTVCTVGDDWDSWTIPAKVDSGGLIMLDWGDSHFALKYNVMRAYSIDMQGDTVEIAGRDLPVSRHGLGHTSKMTVTGRIINPAKMPAIGDMWLAELRQLEEPHDWILRAPGGMRRRISIETYVPQFDDSTSETLADITITANEVSDGLD